MLKKNYKLILLVTLLLITIILINRRESSTMSDRDTGFAVDDTATVTRIFMADKAGNSVELARDTAGRWTVNKAFNARGDAIDILLKTMLNMEVQAPVSKAGRNNVIKRLAAKGVKVEVYQSRHRINIFGKLKLFPHEKKTRTYYVGSQTQDNLGTYMLMEGSEMPVITGLPGFRGFISVRFSPYLSDWRDHTIFDQPINEIRSVKVEFVETPGLSHITERADERRFTLKDLRSGIVINNYDTTKLLDYLVSYSSIRFEAFLAGLKPEFVDSVKRSQPFHIITLTDMQGRQHVVKTFHKKNPGGDYDENGNLVYFDRDRMYALVNDGRDFVLVQFFVFDNILRPLEYFLKLPEQQ